TLDPPPFGLARRGDAQLEHECAIRREAVDQFAQQCRLVVRVVQGGSEQDHVERTFRQLLPALAMELALRETLPGTLDEALRVVDADRAARTLEVRESAEEPLVAAHVEERP